MKPEGCKIDSIPDPCLLLANTAKRNLGVLDKRVPELFKELLEFVGDVYNISAEFKFDGNSLLEFGYFNVIEPNSFYLPYLLLQCAIPQFLYTMRLIMETLMSGIYADIAVIGREPDPSLHNKLIMYASRFSMSNLVSPREFGEYYAQVVRRIEEPLRWLMDDLGLESGGLVNYVYLIYDELSKLLHPVTTMGGKLFLGVVIDAYLAYGKYGFPANRHIYLPAECDEVDEAWLRTLRNYTRHMRFVLYTMTYSWAVNTGLMETKGLETLKQKIKNLVNANKVMP